MFAYCCRSRDESVSSSGSECTVLEASQRPLKPQSPVTQQAPQKEKKRKKSKDNQRKASDITTQPRSRRESKSASSFCASCCDGRTMTASTRSSTTSTTDAAQGVGINIKATSANKKRGSRTSDGNGPHASSDSTASSSSTSEDDVFSPCMTVLHTIQSTVHEHHRELDTFLCELVALCDDMDKEFFEKHQRALIDENRSESSNHLKVVVPTSSVHSHNTGEVSLHPLHPLPSLADRVETNRARSVSLSEPGPTKMTYSDSGSSTTANGGNNNIKLLSGQKIDKDALSNVLGTLPNVVPPQPRKLSDPSTVRTSSAPSSNSARSSANHQFGSPGNDSLSARKLLEDVERCFSFEFRQKLDIMKQRASRYLSKVQLIIETALDDNGFAPSRCGEEKRNSVQESEPAAPQIPTMGFGSARISIAVSNLAGMNPLAPPAHPSSTKPGPDPFQSAPAASQKSDEFDSPLLYLSNATSAQHSTSAGYARIDNSTSFHRRSINNNSNNVDGSLLDSRGVDPLSSCGVNNPRNVIMMLQNRSALLASQQQHSLDVASLPGQRTPSGDIDNQRGGHGATSSLSGREGARNTINNNHVNSTEHQSHRTTGITNFIPASFTASTQSARGSGKVVTASKKSVDGPLVTMLSDGDISRRASALGGGSPETTASLCSDEQESTPFAPVQSVFSMQTPNNFALTHSLTKTTDDVGLKILNNDYVILDTIGQGSCGKVKLGFSMRSNISVAIKIVRRPSRSSSLVVTAEGASASMFGRELDTRLATLHHEIALMKKLRHPNIVSLLEVIDDPTAEKLYLVMQFLDKGCIARVSSQGTCTAMPLDRVLFIAKQVAAGLQYLHSHGVVHRDLKPENILISSNDQVYLSDFGISDVFSRRMRSSSLSSSAIAEGTSSRHDGEATNPLNQLDGGGNEKLFEQSVHSRHVGTPLFMAPELLLNAEERQRLGGASDAQSSGDFDCDASVDIWAFGVTLVLLVEGRLPFLSREDVYGYFARAHNALLARNEGNAAALNSAGSQLYAMLFPDHLVANSSRSSPGSDDGGCAGGCTLPTGWQDLLASMLDVRPEKRPKISYVRRKLKRLDTTKKANY